MEPGGRMSCQTVAPITLMADLEMTLNPFASPWYGPYEFKLEHTKRSAFCYFQIYI